MIELHPGGAGEEQGGRDSHVHPDVAADGRPRPRVPGEKADHRSHTQVNAVIMPEEPGDGRGGCGVRQASSRRVSDRRDKRQGAHCQGQDLRIVVQFRACGDHQYGHEHRDRPASREFQRQQKHQRCGKRERTDGQVRFREQVASADLLRPRRHCIAQRRPRTSQFDIHEVAQGLFAP